MVMTAYRPIRAALAEWRLLRMPSRLSGRRAEFVDLDGLGVDRPIRVDPRVPHLALAPASPSRSISTKLVRGVLGGRWYTFDPRNNTPRIGGC